MARARLEYDDSGTTFYYFLLSFYALILLPITYFIYPRKKKDEDSKVAVCQCEPCLSKKVRVQLNQPRQWMTTSARYVVLLVLWSVLLLMVWKVVTTDKDYVEYDPFEILQLDPGTSMPEIRKQYRRLSKVFHPDKQGGDQDMFMKIAKAYEALTDEESRENWEKWGNPDGPQAATFGIALPSWVVEKQNSLWVLAVYMAIFMVGLPLLVGVWWYRSIKYGSSNVLLQTTQIFAYFLNNSRTMPGKRVLMVLTAAMEFNHEMSQLVPTRPSDDVELSKIISSKALPHVQVKAKERFLSAPYAVKTRILLHSHLERVTLHSSFLESDQRIVLGKSPQLIQEMISVLCQLWVMHHTRPGAGHPPSVDLFEEVMKVSGVIVQAMWLLGNSPLLQLPHLSPALLRHFRTKKRNIVSMEQFASLSSAVKRSLVRTLTDEEYSDLLAVCAKFPKVTIEAKTQVVDDDNVELITAKSLVTLNISLSRRSLQDIYSIMPMDDHTTTAEEGKRDGVETLFPAEREEEDAGEVGNGNPSNMTSTAKRTGKKASVASRKKAKGQANIRRRTVNPKKLKKVERAGPAPREAEEASQSEGEGEGQAKAPPPAAPRPRRGSVSGSSEGEESGGEGPEQEEEEWERLQQSLNKHSKKKFEQLATDSHTVHAPYFPQEKFELWWLYVVDRKKREMKCLPTKITGLMNEYATELQFAAPDRPGQYRYSVVLRSDSYLDLSFSQDIKLNVGAQQEVSGRGQWAELEKEEEEQEMIEESLSEQEESSEELSDSD